MKTVVTTDQVEFRLNGWLENVAICGLVNILGKENVTMEEQRIIVPLDKLTDFEEKYFAYFAKKYHKQSAMYRIMHYQEIKERLEQNEFETFTKDDYAKLQEYLKKMKQAVNSNSFQAVYPLIDSPVDIMAIAKDLVLPKLKKNEWEDNQPVILANIQIIFEKLNLIYAYFERPDSQRYFPAKSQIYTTINKGYNDVSFLNRQESKGDFFIKYHAYFIEPIFDYMGADHKKDKLSCANCNRLLKKGDISYSFINQAGFDSNRKLSNAWDFVNDLFMCPMCRLLYTCIPAGFTYVFDQGLFVNDNHSVETLITVNEGIHQNVLELNKDEVRTTNTYAALIRTLQTEKLRQEKKSFIDIQVVRYEQDRYYFNILPRHILKTIADSEEQLQWLFNAGFSLNGNYHSVYQETVTHLMNNANLFNLIQQILRLKATTENAYLNTSQIMSVIKINQNFMKELIAEMEPLSEKELTRIRKDGYWFKTKYPNENKPKSIGLRLLNALKANDKNSFMDVLLNSYMYLNLYVPTYFNEIFLDDERFKTIGYTFVTGLIGNNEKETEGGNEDE